MKRTFYLFLSFLTLATSSTLLAQVGTDGSILGLVKDSTEAVIPRAEVKITNLDTGLTKTANTDEAGYFEALALPRGFYSVTVSLPGFKTWKLERTELTVAEAKRLAPVLEVGEFTEQVNVVAGVELVQTEKASIEAGIEQKQIRDLPINGRNPIHLVNLVPGMRFVNVGGIAREHTVQGVGQRDDQTEFLLDGLNSNEPSNEKGTAFPNVDTIAEFNVQTSNFTAENGRNPLQVILITKGGTNEFHGTLWEFHKNDALNARNAFALDKPKLIQNQFGFTLGGPILKDKTHFFGSFEGTRIRQERIYNSPTASLAMLRGDFSALSKTINDPLTGTPFPNNIIPESRFSSASRFFFPYLVLPNSPNDRFRAVAPRRSDTNNDTLRIDHQITNNQRIYGRWVFIDQQDKLPQYKPDVFQNQSITQHNSGLNYNWNISPTTLLTAAGGYLQSDTYYNSPAIGKENLTQQAGIQGFPTEGRANAVGLPNVTIMGYTGISLPSNTPGRFFRSSIDSKAGTHLIRGRHSADFGYQFNNRRTLARHASASARGSFAFNNQYTGDSFADYLLGLISFSERNFPLESFGMADSPYSAFYIQDFWRIHPDVTINLGLRFDYWHEKAFVRGTGSTFDLALKKAVAGEDKHGRVDLTSQPTAPFLAKATEGLWIPASQAGVPPGLFRGGGYLSPRLGVAWRPRGGNDLVIRAGYGIFASSFNGNIVGSQVIGPPYWTFERQNFGRLSQQRWETAFPADPRAFIAPSVTAPIPDVNPMKMHEWNLSIQKSLPFLQAALTVSYVGNRGRDLVTQQSHNDPPPGQYSNIQAASPFPQFSTIRLYENIGNSWYNSLQLKFERRFTRGLSYTLAYAFARHIEQFGTSLTDRPTPFAPKGYDRGRSELERRHILTINGIWEVPFGRGRAYAKNLHPVANAILGGWQLATIYNFTSGVPLSINVQGETLGNGWGTRANLVGDPKLSKPSVDQWFNVDAFAAPPRFTFGNSGLGIIDGPGDHSLHLGLMKNFYFVENKYLQLRAEMFNAPNHVNLGNPVTTLGNRDYGRINSANAAREIQLGLKLVF